MNGEPPPPDTFFQLTTICEFWIKKTLLTLTINPAGTGVEPLALLQTFRRGGGRFDPAAEVSGILAAIEAKLTALARAPFMPRER